jgi:hydroxyacylglutathione hydrolase
VYCGHEYTLANIRFALAAEADNGALTARRTEVEALLARNLPSLPSTIGAELSMNPFLRAHLPALGESASRHSRHVLRSEVEVFAALREWKNGF